MPHAISNHISTQTALAASGTVKTQIVQPKADGRISAGVANDQSQSLASVRVSTGASTATTLVDSIATPWTASAYIGHIAEVVAGTNLGFARLITANTNQALTVDVAFPAANDATTRFNIREPSRSCVVVKGWTLDHTGTAGTLRLETKGLVGSTMTTRTLFVYTTAGTSGIDSKASSSFVCIPGTDIRVSPSAAMAGNVTMDAYFVHDSITALIDN